MRRPDSIIIGSLYRWIFIQMMGAAAIFFWNPGSWPVILSLLFVSAFSTYFIINYLQTYNVFTIKDSDYLIDPTLRIANETLPYLRSGLNEETAYKTAEIIKKISNVDAVAITDREKVLAYIGVGSDHHQSGGPIITRATKQVLLTGELTAIGSKKALNCPVKSCPLESAVIVPLRCKGEVAGTVKLYQVTRGQIQPGLVRLAAGITQLLGIQMELAELDRQAQLVTKAELDALQAQINPHFLFNTLNTIIMFSRTNPEVARRLLIRLASFFRHTLKRHGHFNTLKEEIEYVNTYLVLEKARFREKLRVERDIDQKLMDCLIPVLTLQPLVENAVKHGITPKVGPGTVRISAHLGKGELFIIVKDDGVGISSENLPKVLLPGYGSNNGVGLSNVNERLKSLFGETHGLEILSETDKGTEVHVRVPLIWKGSEEGGDLNEA